MSNHYTKDWHMRMSQRNIGAKGSRHCRAATLPEEYVPEIKEHLQSVGLKWEDFKVTDNSCKPHPPAENPLVAVSPLIFGCQMHLSTCLNFSRAGACITHC